MKKGKRIFGGILLAVVMFLYFLLFSLIIILILSLSDTVLIYESLYLFVSLFDILLILKQSSVAAVQNILLAVVFIIMIVLFLRPYLTKDKEPESKEQLSIKPPKQLYELSEDKVLLSFAYSLLF